MIIKRRYARSGKVEILTLQMLPRMTGAEEGMREGEDLLFKTCRLKRFDSVVFIQRVNDVWASAVVHYCWNNLPRQFLFQNRFRDGLMRFTFCNWLSSESNYAVDRNSHKLPQVYIIDVPYWILVCYLRIPLNFSHSNRLNRLFWDVFCSSSQLPHTQVHLSISKRCFEMRVINIGCGSR